MVTSFSPSVCPGGDSGASIAGSVVDGDEHAATSAAAVTPKTGTRRFMPPAYADRRCTEVTRACARASLQFPAQQLADDLGLLERMSDGDDGGAVRRRHDHGHARELIVRVAGEHSGVTHQLSACDVPRLDVALPRRPRAGRR